MINVTGNDKNTINYSCDCGATGFCTIKPMEKEAAIVIDVRCPLCFEVERIVMVQYREEKTKRRLEKSLNEIDLSWSSTLVNKINWDDLKNVEE